MGVPFGIIPLCSYLDQKLTNLLISAEVLCPEQYQGCAFQWLSPCGSLCFSPPLQWTFQFIFWRAMLLIPLQSVCFEQCFERFLHSLSLSASCLFCFVVLLYFNYIQPAVKLFVADAISKSKCGKTRYCDTCNVEVKLSSL